jgi:hypothetical protein
MKSNRALHKEGQSVPCVLKGVKQKSQFDRAEQRTPHFLFIFHPKGSPSERLMK